MFYKICKFLQIVYIKKLQWLLNNTMINKYNEYSTMIINIIQSINNIMINKYNTMNKHIST